MLRVLLLPRAPCRRLLPAALVPCARSLVRAACSALSVAACLPRWPLLPALPPSWPFWQATCRAPLPAALACRWPLLLRCCSPPRPRAREAGRAASAERVLLGTVTRIKGPQNLLDPSPERAPALRTQHSARLSDARHAVAAAPPLPRHRCRASAATPPPPPRRRRAAAAAPPPPPCRHRCRATAAAPPLPHHTAATAAAIATQHRRGGARRKI